MSNVRTTGMELDILAKHKVTKEQILCECKAHDHEIGPQDLNDFFGKLNHQRSGSILLSFRLLRQCSKISQRTKRYPQREF